MTVNFSVKGLNPTFKGNNNFKNNASQCDSCVTTAKQSGTTDLAQRKAEFLKTAKTGLFYRNSMMMRLGQTSDIVPITDEYLEQLWQETLEKEIKIQKKVDANRALYKSMGYKINSPKINNANVLSKKLSQDGYKLINTVKLLNRATGKYEQAFILSNNRGTIELYCNDENLGKINITDYNGLTQAVKFDKTSQEYAKGNFLYIDSLETKNKGLDATVYRGIGTELLKQAVIESQKRGFEGRIGLVASLWDEQGRAARDFYKHIGFQTASSEDDYVFILPENKINDFLQNP